MKSNNVRNIKRSISNTAAAATGTIAVATEVTADLSEFLANSISSTPAVLKALLQAPFSAAKGYLIEAEGLNEEQAEAIAFHYLNQDLAVTVREGSEGLGKAIASLLEDDDDDVNTGNTQTPEQRNQQIINAA